MTSCRLRAWEQGRVVDLQARRGVAKHDVVAGIIASDPSIREHGRRHRVRHGVAILGQGQKPGGEHAPPLIEDVESIADAASLQQTNQADRGRIAPSPDRSWFETKMPTRDRCDR